MSFAVFGMERVVTSDYVYLTDYRYRGEEEGVAYKFEVERSDQVHRVLMSTFYQGEPKVKNLPVFTEPQDISGKYVEIADATLLSDGQAAILIAERHCLYALLADRLDGILELIQLTGAGSVSGSKIIEHNGLIYVAYAALPANHWRNREFVYTRIQYRVRTSHGRWTKERILYSTSAPFWGPVSLEWTETHDGLILNVRAERPYAGETGILNLSLSVPEEDLGA